MSADDALKATFGAASPEHFAWQTTQPYVCDEERALVRAAFEPLGRHVLDLGCGEGATLWHLGAPAGAVGVDLFPSMVAFARGRLAACRFAAASALALPFRDRSFDHILVRDLIHHIADPAPLVDECARLLRPGGRLDVLEPCGGNPLIALHALTQPVERGELRSTLPYLTRLISRRFNIESQRRLQAMPLHRLVFHPKLGFPSLASAPTARRWIKGLERMAVRLTPEAGWAYIHVRGRVA